MGLQMEPFEPAAGSGFDDLARIFNRADKSLKEVRPRVTNRSDFSMA